MTRAPAPFAYLGSKVKLAPWIVEQLPDHRTYVEPFAGSLAVLMAKPPAPCEVVNDLNDNIVAFFRVVRDRVDDLVALLDNTPHARAELAHALEVIRSDEADDLERARCWLLACEASFSGRIGAGYAWSPHKRVNHAATYRRRIARLDRVAERLRGVMIERADALTILERADTPDTVGYLDPPYEASTRQARAYLEDGTDELHVDLAAWLRGAAGTYLVAGYHSTAYAELFGGWTWTIERDVIAWSANATNGTARQARTEVMWANRPLPGWTGPDGVVVPPVGQLALPGIAATS